jgi:iron-sulfur cluster assembly protein
MKPILLLSESAIKQCKGILTKSEKKYLHLYVKKSGCSGFKYVLNPVDNKIPDNVIFNINDIPFLIPNKNLIYLFGTYVDWNAGSIESSFRFNNPNVANHCGCGSSFIPKRNRINKCF